MPRKVFIIPAVIVFILVVALVHANQNTDALQSRTRFLMDTYCTIKIPGGTEVLDVIDTAFDRMAEVQRTFDSLDPESPIHAFNDENVTITNPEIVALIKTALEVGDESGGAFDITVFPLVNLWGFFGDSPAVPDREKIDELLNAVDYRHLSIKAGTLVKDDARVKIDLGGIAKGYAIREAVAVLKKAGITSALIDAGGEIYALGTNKGKPWKIGIRDPRGEGTVGVLELTDCTVATSGDYERYFEKDGKRYHHILDPKTGYSAEGITSVTVVTDDPAVADAWSTALFVLGKEKGRELMERNKFLKVLMITQDGEFISSNM